MTEFKITRPMPQVEGVASTVKDLDVREAYAGAVEKFVRDNSGMGKDWQNGVLNLLLGSVKAPVKDGDWRSSQPYMLTFMQEYIDGLDLITLQKLRQAYEQNGNKTPFPGNYVETGLALIPEKDGSFNRNKDLARRLSEEVVGNALGSKRDAKVFNFAQLKLIPDKDVGLVFVLNESATSKNILNLEDYEWDHRAFGGLYRACLGRDSDWYVSGGDLEGSDEVGRVVRYDAEGVAPKKLGFRAAESKDEIQQRLDNFRNLRV